MKKRKYTLLLPCLLLFFFIGCEKSELIKENKDLPIQVQIEDQIRSFDFTYNLADMYYNCDSGTFHFPFPTETYNQCFGLNGNRGGLTISNSTGGEENSVTLQCGSISFSPTSGEIYTVPTMKEWIIKPNIVCSNYIFKYDFEYVILDGNLGIDTIIHDTNCYFIGEYITCI